MNLKTDFKILGNEIIAIGQPITIEPDIYTISRNRIQHLRLSFIFNEKESEFKVCIQYSDILGIKEDDWGWYVLNVKKFDFSSFKYSSMKIFSNILLELELTGGTIFLILSDINLNKKNVKKSVLQKVEIINRLEYAILKTHSKRWIKEQHGISDN